MTNTYLPSLIKQLVYYKNIAEQAFSQISEEQLFIKFGEGNSIAILINHLAGNMRSRFTDFLTSDGEKPWRDRDLEFVEPLQTEQQLLLRWEEGWKQLLNTLHQLDHSQLDEIIYIRNEPHSVMEALNRQLAHYPYHIGQMVLLAKMLAGKQWKSLSIPLGQSQTYNNELFGRNRQLKHPKE